MLSDKINDYLREIRRRPLHYNLGEIIDQLDDFEDSVSESLLRALK